MTTIQGEIKGHVRWGRQFSGPLLRETKEAICVALNANIVWFKRDELLWVSPDADPNDFKYPDEFPQTEELRNSPINGTPPQNHADAIYAAYAAQRVPMEVPQTPKQIELIKLERQLQDERFMNKAPESAIQKVVQRIKKLEAELATEIVPCPNCRTPMQEYRGSFWCPRITVSIREHHLYSKCRKEIWGRRGHEANQKS